MTCLVSIDLLAWSPCVDMHTSCAMFTHTYLATGDDLSQHISNPVDSLPAPQLAPSVVPDCAVAVVDAR